MKKNILTCSALFILGITYAQKITVSDGSEKFSNGSHNAYSATIYETSKNVAMSNFKSLLKDLKNEKVKTDNGEIFGDNILIKEWGNNPVDIYATFEENKAAKTVIVHVAFDLGGAYLSGSDGDKHNYAKKMVKDFAVKTTKESMGDKVKQLEDILEKLEENQKDLLKDDKNLKQDIVNYKQEIVKDEKDIASKKTELEKKKSEIDVQKKVVDASSGAVNEQAKSSQKIHEKLMDQEKDIQKEIKNLKDDIESSNNKIKKAESDLKKNESDQVTKKSEIDTQKKLVDDAKKVMEKVD
jgi:DNA repair exonuclease SbcCD ATPase subunit